MRTKKVISLKADQVKDFVRAANACNFDIDIAGRGRESMTVDAKSILGVFGLDLGSPLIVTYSGYDKNFEEALGKYKTAV